MVLTELLFLGIGLILGGFILFLIFNNRLNSEKKLSAERINDLNRSIEEEKKSNDQKEKEILDLTGRISARESDYKHLNDKMLEHKSEIEEIQEKFRIEFRNLANDILEEKTKKFTEQNSVRLGEILNPLNQKN